MLRLRPVEVRSRPERPTLIEERLCVDDERDPIEDVRLSAAVGGEDDDKGEEEDEAEAEAEVEVVVCACGIGDGVEIGAMVIGFMSSVSESILQLSGTSNSCACCGAGLDTVGETADGAEVDTP